MLSVTCCRKQAQGSARQEQDTCSEVWQEGDGQSSQRGLAGVRYCRFTAQPEPVAECCSCLQPGAATSLLLSCLFRGITLLSSLIADVKKGKDLLFRKRRTGHSVSLLTRLQGCCHGFVGCCHCHSTASSGERTAELAAHHLKY